MAGLYHRAWLDCSLPENRTGARTADRTELRHQTGISAEPTCMHEEAPRVLCCRHRPGGSGDGGSVKGSGKLAGGLGASFGSGHSPSLIPNNPRVL